MTRFVNACPGCATAVETRHLTHAHAKDCALRNPCPDCHRRVGQWCQGPGGHKAMNLHKSRRALATAADPALERGPEGREPPPGVDPLF